MNDFECMYCNRIIEDGDDSVTPPPASNDAAWEALAKLHYANCEWILTRAHQLPSHQTENPK